MNPELIISRSASLLSIRLQDGQILVVVVGDVGNVGNVGGVNAVCMGVGGGCESSEKTSSSSTSSPSTSILSSFVAKNCFRSRAAGEGEGGEKVGIAVSQTRST